MLQNILNYWYQSEFFNPCWPIDSQKDTNLCKSQLPWLRVQENPGIQVSYDVYLGKVKSRELVIHMLNCLELPLNQEEIERDNSLTCVCALKVDQNGRYVANSFALSSFVWAIGFLTSKRSISAKLEISILENLQKRLDSEILKMQEENKPLSLSDLDRLLMLACIVMKLEQQLFEGSIWSRKKVQYPDTKGQFPPLDPATELIQSFYLKDIDQIKNMPTDTIKCYTLSMIQGEEKHIQIDKDVSQMQQWLHADAFPKGMWPSEYSPSLMQQLGINLAIAEEQPIFSVNGPPGTGKTTLLKEIVASNIVQRAMVMERYENPDDAFRRKAFKNPPGYNPDFFMLDNELAAYGILVASNNNAAVENISVELPKAIKKDRTKHFAVESREENENTYFADVATKLLNEPAWGLVSARLGKKSNLKELKERLWWANDGITLKHYYDTNKVPDWNEARKNFRKALQAVQTMQDKIMVAQNLLLLEQEALQEFKAAQNRCEEEKEVFSREKRTLESMTQDLDELQQQLAVQEKNRDDLRKRISIFKRIFLHWFPNDPIVKEWCSAKQEVDRLVIQMTKQRASCQMQESAVLKAKRQYQAAEQVKERAQQRFDKAQSDVVTVRKEFGDNWADSTFWKDIVTNERSQEACPWTTSEYNRLREELFFQALMLHKAFVLSSQCVRKNLMRLFALWDGKFEQEDCNIAHGHLLNTLLLVIPVVSTTFASVQTFLAGVQAKEIGLLIIDEAGQATPQSALGALWRSKKAIIVGDPLQVEPIVTIPKELCKQFAKENAIPVSYQKLTLSVQMLADRLNRYGGVRKCNGEDIWVGCPLIVHRRCIEPMFSISNEVAYNRRMVFKTPPPKPEKMFLLESSVWIDCGGEENGNKDHAVKNQVLLATKLLKRAINLYKGLPDLYVITPFTSVEYALKKAFREIIRENLPKMDDQHINDWLKENCGTVHAFQGKEAQEVLLVLGCDSRNGRGAAKWVGQKPNIINVAVSRAKYRVGVIGDYDLWKNIPYVQTVCKHLERVDASLYD